MDLLVETKKLRLLVGTVIIQTEIKISDCAGDGSTSNPYFNPSFAGKIKLSMNEGESPLVISLPLSTIERLQFQIWEQSHRIRDVQSENEILATVSEMILHPNPDVAPYR